MTDRVFENGIPIPAVAQSLTAHPWLQAALAALALVAIAWAANWIAKRVVLRAFMRLLANLPFEVEAAELRSIVARLSNIVPAIVVQAGIGAVPHLPGGAIAVVHGFCSAFVILTVAIALAGMLNLASELYQRRPGATHRPIKGYVQIAKLIVYAAATILVVAALMDRSPLLLLSGLGAMAAVLMLVFKDTILSLVASVQIGSNDMVRVGDWIEMPQLNADGDVIDIALHTVKVQNFDKTITTIPTHRLITESFRNWRGMAESGGRRIKRSIAIDQNSIRFLDADDIEALKRFGPLRDYLESRSEDISRWNADHAGRKGFEPRRLTNIGTFRAYVLAYLGMRGDIADDKTLIVRQLAPGEYGLPLEIYAFADTTAWDPYEGIQADIFDHLLAVLPEFGLRIFQRPTGLDWIAKAA